MESKNKAGEAFQKLVDLMTILREQCPWDKKQTINSLQKYTLEEVYELMDAINKNDVQEIEEELGDVLFHTVFYSQIESEEDHFTITDVLNTVREKLIRRHPHIFGDVSVKDEEEVKRNWEAIKLKEGKKSVLQGVPKSLPAMIKAYRMQQKAAQAGFDWNNPEDVLDKMQEELDELREAVQSGDKGDIESEFGDMLFSMVNYARFIDVDPENSLEKTNQKFKKRFLYIEQMAQKQKYNLSDVPLEQMEYWWQEAKRQETK